MILSDFLKAIGQIGDPRFQKVFFGGIGLSIALLVAVSAAVIWLGGWLIPDAITLPWIGTITWVDTAFSWAALPVMVVLSVVLMVPVASIFTGLFLDTIADAVEARHYPHVPPTPKIPFADGLRDSLSFLGVLIGVNAVVLVLSVFLLPLAPFLFWGANGYLLGREYFQISAMRHLGRDGARAAFRAHRGQIWLAGLLMAVPLTFPLINLVIPILGAATFTHVFHRVTSRN